MADVIRTACQLGVAAGGVLLGTATVESVGVGSAGVGDTVGDDGVGTGVGDTPGAGVLVPGAEVALV